jgi:hypothetical protein
MQLDAGLKSAKFHDWYKNAHGPGILRPPFFTGGFQYQATDNKQPEWLAMYECSNMSKLLTPQYTDLFQTRSLREAQIFSKLSFDRNSYDLVSSRQSPEIMFDLLKSGDVELVAVSMTLIDIENAEVQFDRWYEEEHIDLLSKVPGWLRKRRFKISSNATDKEVTYLTLYEYSNSNGLGGKEHRAAISTSWRDDFMSNYVKEKPRRTYRLWHVFGLAPSSAEQRH